MALKNYRELVEMYERRIAAQNGVAVRQTYDYMYKQACAGLRQAAADRWMPSLEEVKALKDDLANSERRATPADLAKPCAPVQSEPDRIWDLIVLAAESSRYDK